MTSRSSVAPVGLLRSGSADDAGEGEGRHEGDERHQNHGEVDGFSGRHARLLEKLRSNVPSLPGGGLDLAQLFRVFSLALLPLAMAPVPWGRAVADEAHLASGQRLAQRDCGGCHGVAARDQSPNPDAPPFRLLGQRYDVAGLDAALRGGMLVGHPRMPMIVLDEDEIADLSAYVKSIQATPL